MKVSSSDALAVLKQFRYATDDHAPRHIEQLVVTNPSPHNTMAAFRFNKQRFYLLFDSTAEDDTSFITSQVQVADPNVFGVVVENPAESTMTYGLPFKGKDVYLFVVDSGKRRLDHELAERYPDSSRSTWQKHIRAGHIAVNGVPETSPSYSVVERDIIAINKPEQIDFSEHTLPIIYLDDNVIVIDKPAGVLTHSKGALNDEFTVADFFRHYTTAGLDSSRPGIVHRLDRDTSGVMIGARNADTATLLQKQFADRKVKKIYQAVVKGSPKAPTATIDLPIGRNPSAPSTFRVDPKGKSAQTTYRTLETDGKKTLLELQPYTGRTHQLRVHMQYIGTPIVGDRVYGKAADRLYLHAASLELTIPQGDRRTFSAPVPASFRLSGGEAG